MCGRVGEPPIYVDPARQRGGNTSHCAGGLTQGGDASGRGAELRSGPSGPFGTLPLYRWYAELRDGVAL